MCFVLTLRDCKLCWRVLQEKPVRPPCGITTPGCISMTTPQRESLPSLSRTLSTPCSLMLASLSCSGTQWKGRSSLRFTASHSALKWQQRCRYSSDMHTATLVSPSYCLRCKYRQILSLFIGNRRCVAFQSGCQISVIMTPLPEV